ncbi:endoplasmic oxidoreductin [Rhizoclosmatium globosum]|uniref:Endoplasmic oxidoreductin n=1 Tax=Rhizoclosmatium globosum TaxID=329046 RepID=A0A1Y2CQ37_9FUNG|nr:endoplasmic oxidoreductin [Rhizoclosmatium globosum]|eukprot:ORY49151.1 endoplasmic oxidoreductin [Rhizoclosmatium globosum]
MNPQRLLAALAWHLHPLFNSISESIVETPSGVIKDACCEYKTIEQVNDEIAPYLDDLIDLNRGCKFWKEDGLCVNEGCASDLPKDLRTESLSSVDYSLTAQASFPFFQKSCEFNDADFCVIDDPVALREVPYVNLVKNPERFTGYAGDSAARVWGAIYKENCFGGGEEVSGGRGEGQCMEKRVFYRLVSGLHSSISTHICDQWLDQKTGTWSLSVGKFPDRIQNMYFTYVVLLRAISKISPYLETTEWCSSATDKKRIGTLMKGIVEKTLSCPPTFDETTMFTDSALRSLKEEFKNHFRNISLIMDCVGCEKCRLWGKLQITGLGTALRFFLVWEDPSLYRLTRTELVSLINGFHRISNSLRAVERFRNRIKDQTDNMVKWSVGALVMVIGFVGLFYGQTSETKA